MRLKLVFVLVTFIIGSGIMTLGLTILGMSPKVPLGPLFLIALGVFIISLGGSVLMKLVDL